MPVDSKLTASSEKLIPEKQIAGKLLAHYDRHARTLPWRAPPGANATDPYRVWLSEIMLQQTTVAAVIPYFQKFTTRWPDVSALAAADEAELMAAWAGLGYYARARNLIACARAVVRDHDGAFPPDADTLRSLPGVGAYTSAAISAIAFGRRAVAVDANVERVVARLFAIDTPLPGGRREIDAAADGITPDARAGDFTQAMMDLGATICTSRKPACGICPLREDCAAFRTADPAAFPVKAAKKAKPHRTGHAWWIENGGDVWLERRPDKGLLGGMRGVPTSVWRVAGGGEGDSPPDYPFAGRWTALSDPVVHIFTHFSLALTVHTVRAERDCMAGRDGEWWPKADLASAGLPTLFGKVAAAAMREELPCP
ncbi:A/G-specific adenine glycosylase [Sphingobium phenoxybenzoativorans]|uniref:Adenine DNA glycosylase n=1 Tax=Sphingobium phenoxybenzoativorans TaxID=1592790 RepID=A0A975Q2G2_9SPHN|nr:A/G-specific adenine glycosylase [Sphingobium phenoxybenzoativorans]QUT06403.1 A/G-specific adenine glycosylase [Sphingobium phenoxybenzoativorans]